MTWTDKRVGLMNEIVNSIQMIKFYAWESSFKAAVMEVRDKEAGILKRMVWVQSIFVMLLFSGPVMMAVAVFAGQWSLIAAYTDAHAAVLSCALRGVHQGFPACLCYLCSPSGSSKLRQTSL